MSVKTVPATIRDFRAFYKDVRRENISTRIIRAS